MKKTYNVQLFCANCETNIVAQVKHGITYMDYCESASCTNCGCKTLRKAANQLKISPRKGDLDYYGNPIPNHLLPPVPINGVSSVPPVIQGFC